MFDHDVYTANALEHAAYSVTFANPQMDTETHPGAVEKQKNKTGLSEKWCNNESVKLLQKSVRG